MRELLQSINHLESQLMKLHAISINEAMSLCCIGNDTLTASAISEAIGLTPSNTSKVLRSVESKGLVVRSLGSSDRRQMCFTLTDAGHETLQSIKNCPIDIPEFIRPLF